MSNVTDIEKATKLARKFLVAYALDEKLPPDQTEAIETSVSVIFRAWAAETNAQPLPADADKAWFDLFRVCRYLPARVLTNDVWSTFARYREEGKQFPRSLKILLYAHGKKGRWLKMLDEYEREQRRKDLARRDQERLKADEAEFEANMADPDYRAKWERGRDEFLRVMRRLTGEENDEIGS